MKQCEQGKMKSVSPRRVRCVDNTEFLRESEPVSLDVKKIRNGRQLVAAWVAVCQQPLRQKKQRTDYVIYSAKIRRLPMNKQTNYNTRYSGLTRLDLCEQAILIDEVRDRLRLISRNRLIVGIGLDEDLKSLGLQNEIPRSNRYDFLDHFKDSDARPINLKSLAYGFLGKRIQEFAPNFDPERCHDPIIDSRMTIMIFYAKDHANNQPLNGSFQWIRNLVDEAKGCGLIRS